MTALHAETFGKGKPIVMLHGWAMHSGMWRDFARELSKQYQVTLIDLPGHGRSQTARPFTLEAVGKAIIEIIPDEQSCWLGWSLGAEISLAIASAYPARVNRLILLAGSPCFVRNSQWPGLERRILDSFADSLLQDSRAALLRFLSLQVTGESASRKTLRELKTLVLECNPPDRQTLMGGLQMLKETDLRTELAKLQIPVAAVLGELDTLVPVAVAGKLRELLPKTEVTVIPRAGHAPFLSHRNESIAAVCRFMERSYAN